MTHYLDKGFSDSDVAAAVAEAIVFEVRKSLSSLSGFPQIRVSRDSTHDFSVKLSWNHLKAGEVEFQLTEIETQAALRFFKSGSGGSHPTLVKKVQEFLPMLEAKVR